MRRSRPSSASASRRGPSSVTKTRHNSSLKRSSLQNRKSLDSGNKKRFSSKVNASGLNSVTQQQQQNDPMRNGEAAPMWVQSSTADPPAILTRRNTVSALRPATSGTAGPSSLAAQKRHSSVTRPSSYLRKRSNGATSESFANKRKRSAPVVHIPTTKGHPAVPLSNEDGDSSPVPNAQHTPSKSPSTNPSHNLEHSPDSPLRQIFRSSSPSLMMELSRLLGPQDTTYMHRRGSPSSPLKRSFSNGSTGSSPSSPSSGPIGLHISRAKFHQSPKSGKTSPSKKFATSPSSQQTAESTSPIATSQQRATSPFKRRESTSSPLSQIRQLSEHDRNNSSPSPTSPNSATVINGRAISPQSYYVNPESILNRSPVILQKRPKSTHVLEKMIRERNGRPGSARLGGSSLSVSGSQSAHHRGSTSAMAAEISKRRSSHGRDVHSASSPNLRRSSESPELANGKYVPHIRLNRMNPSQMEDMEEQRSTSTSNTTGSINKIEIIRPHSASVSTKRKKSASQFGRRSSSTARRRRPSSSSSGRRTRTSRSSHGAAQYQNIGPGHFQSREAGTNNKRASALEDFSRNISSSNRPLSSSSSGRGTHLIYQSRGAGFMSTRRSTNPSDTPKWKSFERARSKKLKRPSSASTTHRRGRGSSNASGGGMNNFLHIQSISVTQGSDTRVHSNG